MSALVERAKRMGWGSVRESVLFAGAGLAVGALAWASIPASLVVGGVAVLVVFAALWPVMLLALLVGLVLLQDPLVMWGVARAQQADEALVLAGIGGVGLWAVGKRRLGRTPFDLPLLAFIAVGALAAAVRGVPLVVAALGMLALLKGLLAAQLGARLRLTDATVRRGARLILGVVALMALLGVAQRVFGLPMYRLTGQESYFAPWQGGKAPALFAHHNALGHVCVLGGALALGLALRAPRQGRRIWLIVAGSSLLGLLASASRESWLAAGAALLAIAALTGSRRLWRIALATAVVLAIGGALVYASSPVLRAEVARRGAGVVDGWHDYRLGFTGWAFRGEYRVYVLLKSWEIFLDHPLLGAGPGRFGGHVASLHPSPIYEQYSFLPLDGVHGPLDVFYSRLLGEFGLLGAAAFAWAAAVAARAHHAAWRTTEPTTSGLGLGGLMATVAVLVVAAFSPALEDPLVAIPFWLWAGLCWHRAGAATDRGLPR